MAENGTSKSRKESLDPRPWHGHTADLKWSEFSVKPQKPGLDSSCTAMFWASMFDVMGSVIGIAGKQGSWSSKLRIKRKRKQSRKLEQRREMQMPFLVRLLASETCHPDQSSIHLAWSPYWSQNPPAFAGSQAPSFMVCQDLYGRWFNRCWPQEFKNVLKKSSCWLDPRFLPKMFQAKLVTVHHSFFLGDPSFCQLSTQQHIKSACASAKFHCCFHEIH